LDISETMLDIMEATILNGDIFITTEHNFLLSEGYKTIHKVP